MKSINMEYLKTKNVTDFNYDTKKLTMTFGRPQSFMKMHLVLCLVDQWQDVLILHLEH